MWFGSLKRPNWVASRIELSNWLCFETLSLLQYLKCNNSEIQHNSSTVLNAREKYNCLYINVYLHLIFVLSTGILSQCNYCHSCYMGWCVILYMWCLILWVCETLFKYNIWIGLCTILTFWSLTTSCVLCKMFLTYINEICVTFFLVDFSCSCRNDGGLFFQNIIWEGFLLFNWVSLKACSTCFRFLEYVSFVPPFANLKLLLLRKYNTKERMYRF